MKILVTGANGFVGTSLVPFFLEKGHSVIAQGRKNPEDSPKDFSFLIENITTKTSPNKNLIWKYTGDITPETDWSGILDGVDAVVHLAQRAHVMNDKSADPLNVYRQINVSSMENLVRQSILSGVKKFIFISSIKVNGEFTEASPFRETDSVHPEDPYGISKLEAELLLKNACTKSSMKYVIIRPPLIYGPGVPGNFASLIRIVKKGYPLPFAAVKNKRSMIGISNLIDFINECINNESADNQVFLVSDGSDLSLPELIRKIAAGCHQKANLLYVPVSLLKVLFFVISGNRLKRRLLSSLQVDISKARTLLFWNPPYEPDYDISRAVSNNQLTALYS